LSPTSINLDTNMEFIKMATNREDPSTGMLLLAKLTGVALGLIKS